MTTITMITKTTSTITTTTTPSGCRYSYRSIQQSLARHEPLHTSRRARSIPEFGSGGNGGGVGSLDVDTSEQVRSVVAGREHGHCVQ